MKIDKITFKNNQAWVTIYKDGVYLGTWHIIEPSLVDWLRQNNPGKLRFMDYEGCEDN